MSSKISGLKSEVKQIQAVFPKTHEFFRTVSASLDDLTFHFIGKNGEKQVISCNITVSWIFQFSLLFLSRNTLEVSFDCFDWSSMFLWVEIYPSSCRKSLLVIGRFSSLHRNRLRVIQLF